MQFLEKSRFRILVVDDEPEIHKIIKHAFEMLFGSSENEIFSLNKRLGSLLGTSTRLDKTDYSYDLIFASQTEQALDRFEELSKGESFDLIFMDIMMPPGETGLELAKFLVSKYLNLHIVFCSAYFDDSMSTIKDIAAQTGSCYLLPKPFKLSFLQKFVHEFLVLKELGAESLPIKI